MSFMIIFGKKIIYSKLILIHSFFKVTQNIVVDTLKNIYFWTMQLQKKTFFIRFNSKSSISCIQIFSKFMHAYSK